MTKARCDTVAHLSDLVDYRIILTLFHRSLRAVLKVSLAPAQRAQAAHSRGECGQIYWRSPSAGNSKSPESRIYDRTLAPGAAHHHQDRRASPCAGCTPA